MGWAQAALVVGSSLLKAKSEIDTGKAEAEAHEFNAKIAERNATMAKDQARVIGLEGDLTLQSLAGEFEAMRAEQRQSIAYMGWQTGGGTPLQLALQMANEQEQTYTNTKYNIKVAEAEAMESAVQDELSAKLERFYGGVAKKAGRTKAASSLLSGISSGMTAYKT